MQSLPYTTPSAVLKHQNVQHQSENTIKNWLNSVKWISKINIVCKSDQFVSLNIITCSCTITFKITDRVNDINFRGAPFYYTAENGQDVHLTNMTTTLNTSQLLL